MGLTLTYSASGLPSGLSIATDSGAITGSVGAQADKASPYQVTISATDGVGVVSTNFQWTVIPQITLQNPGTQYDLEQVDNISLVLRATSAFGFPLFYTANGLPAGLAFDPHTGIISGNIVAGAAANSPYQVVVSARDSTNLVVAAFSMVR